MKKLVCLLVLGLFLGFILIGCDLVVPEEGSLNLTKAKPVKPPSGAHYNLNIIGKKADWSGGGSYDNPDRHTMFVPEDTDEFELTPGNPCLTPNGLPGVTIWMTQCGEECDDFAVLDGNAFDDCKCEFRLAPGKYEVWIAAKAKPPKEGEDFYTNIGGWVFAEDEYGANYYFNIGSVMVKKKDGWLDATEIFYVSCTEDIFGLVACNGMGMWVFDYLNFLIGYDFGDDPDITDAAYFWQYDNHGNKLVKVRFYPN